MSFRRYQGFAIVELMIAMALSLLLGIGIFQVFNANQQTARMTQALSNVQEVGRLSGELIAREVRNADYWGCAGDVSKVTNNLKTSDPAYDEDAYEFAGKGGVSGADNVADGTKMTTPSGGSYDVVPGTDTIELRSLAGQGISINAAMPNTSASIFVDENTISKGDVLGISDCRASDIFQVTNTNSAGSGNKGNEVIHNTGSGSPGNARKEFSQEYDVGSQVLQPVYRSFFISNNADGVPRLMMRDQSGQANELADWVEDLQIEYGIDSDGDGVADIFANAQQIADNAALEFDDVLNVEITIRVASSETAIVEEGIAYSWNGDKALDDSVDLGRLRREFTTTASVRSRLP